MNGQGVWDGDDEPKDDSMDEREGELEEVLWRRYERAAEASRVALIPDPLRVVHLSERCDTDSPAAPRGPVGLCYMSDAHIGNKFTDYAALRDHVALLARASEAYVVLGGDMIHNHKRQRRSGAALYDTIANPDEQWLWLGDILRPLLEAGRVIGAISGNHEHFDVEESGLHSMRAWCKEQGVPYWGHGGVIRFDLGPERYYAALRHEYPGVGSSVAANGRRAIEALPRPAEAGHLDIVCLGHLHVHDLHLIGSATGEVASVRAGTYTLYSEWADQRFGAVRGTPGAPLFVLYRHAHLVAAFKGTQLELGLRFLAWQQGEMRPTQPPALDRRGEG